MSVAGNCEDTSLVKKIVTSLEKCAFIDYRLESLTKPTVCVLCRLKVHDMSDSGDHHSNDSAYK